MAERSLMVSGHRSTHWFFLEFSGNDIRTNLYSLISPKGIEKNMKLEKFHSEPSRMTLYNYGNTSSSSIWYELEYIQEEQKTNPLKKGDRIMQVAFGSGFKCTSVVWLKL